MAAYEPTTLQLPAPNPTVGVSLLAMAAYEPTNLQLPALNPTVGAGLLAKRPAQPPNLFGLFKNRSLSCRLTASSIRSIRKADTQQKAR
jgi:hypothetical protein